MEASVLRVKRKRCVEPVETLIISCKKPRPEEGSSSALNTQVFKLAATVISQNEPVQKYVQEAISRDRTTQVNCPPIGSLQLIKKDLRAWRHAERLESRYRFISCFRPKCEEEDGKSDNTQPADSGEERPYVPEKASTKDEMVAKGKMDDSCQVFDIVKEETEMETVDLKASDPETIMCNSVKMIRERLIVSQEEHGSEHRENPEEFVYDIYYTESTPHSWIQDILSVQPYYYEQELMADDDKSVEVYEDEDDENEENNWRNDYPDEEECSGQEDRYLGIYEDSDEETECGRRYTRDDYCQKVARPCEYDEDEYSD